MPLHGLCVVVRSSELTICACEFGSRKPPPSLGTRFAPRFGGSARDLNGYRDHHRNCGIVHRCFGLAPHPEYINGQMIGTLSFFGTNEYAAH